MKLSSIDLNLLVVFQALVEERHVTRAAQRVDLSQSAMSHALGRLRHIFKDEILVHTPQGLQLTTKAMAMAESVRAALAQIESAFDDQPSFDPQARCRFTLALADMMSLILLPRLECRLTQQAPNMDLVILPSIRGQALGMVDRGEADLAVGRFPDSPPHLRMQHIFRDRLVCFARGDHPALTRRPSLEEYISFSHVVVRNPNDLALVDLVLEALRVQRRVALVVPHYLVVPMILAETDLVATESERLALRFQKLVPLAIQPAPFETPGVDICMSWHPRLDRNSAHRWLREQIAQVVE